MKKHETIINEATSGMSLTSNQFDALVCFNFNNNSYPESSLGYCVRHQKSLSLIKKHFLSYSKMDDVFSPGVYNRCYDKYDICW